MVPRCCDHLHGATTSRRHPNGARRVKHKWVTYKPHCSSINKDNIDTNARVVYPLAPTSEPPTKTEKSPTSMILMHFMQSHQQIYQIYQRGTTLSLQLSKWNISYKRSLESAASVFSILNALLKRLTSAIQQYSTMFVASWNSFR